MRPTLHQLRLFEAVARRLSFTRAAEELFLTQPTVSMQIKQLADDIGLPLFEQIGKRISLTDAGRELHETTRDIFEALRRFEMRVADLHGMKQGLLRVGVASAARYFVPELLGRFMRQYPEVDVRMEIANREQLIERLEANRDDLYILGDVPDDPVLECQPLAEYELVPAAPRGHPLAAERNVPFARFAAERFLAREAGSGSRSLLARVLAEHSAQPAICMEFASEDAIRTAVAAGLGVAVLTRQGLAADPAAAERIAVLDVAGFPIRDTWQIVKRHGKRLSVVAKSFIEFATAGTSRPAGGTDSPPPPRELATAAS